VFKGRGMEFDEVREYTPGDDVRAIDWNVTARTGVPHIKRFVEERELTIMFLVDLSASGVFGSVSQSKNEVAAELCALLAFAAIKNHDKVGLIVFTGQVEMFIPPAKGTGHVLRLIRELLSFRPRQVATNIESALAYLGRVVRKRCIVFLVSDFQSEGYERTLRVLNRKHDVIALSVTDPRELRLPPVGLVELEDAETGERLVIDAGSTAIRGQYERAGTGRAATLAQQFRRLDVDHAPLVTGRDYVKGLVGFFRSRERRMQTA
jgi:uncharacterized protein (DUF58 family)